MLGLEENYNWGKYKIEISGQHFDSVSAISLEIVRNHSDINDYRIKIAHTKKELEAFIVFRLVDFDKEFIFYNNMSQRCIMMD